MKNPSLITLREVAQAANNFLKRYHSSFLIPIPIEDIVEIQLNIKIILLPGLIRDFGVNAFITQSFETIVIDETMYSKQPERIRFTIAEEIGHLFLHKEWYKKNGPTSIEDYLKMQEKIDGILYSYIERQAKTFAGMILMPTSIIKEEWTLFTDRNSLTTPCSVYELPDRFPELAQKFSVSADSLLVRLNFLKLVIVPNGFWEKVRRR